MASQVVGQPNFEIVKDYAEIAKVTTWKSYAVQGVSALIALSLINDIYKRRVAQGMVHMGALGVNWILYNAIWVKDLDELVPVLGATAQRYSEEIEVLTREVDKLKEENRAYSSHNIEHGVHNTKHSEQLREGEKLLAEKREQLAQIQLLIASYAKDPKLMIQNALKLIPESNARARDFARRAIEVL